MPSRRMLTIDGSVAQATQIHTPSDIGTLT
jgi:hypothetical protein